MKRQGFTLIELLVVISIIALLLSILMPALTKVKDQARSVVCSSNLRQLAVAIDTYSADHESKSLNNKGGIEAWFLQLAPYMGDAKYKDNPQKALEGSMKVLWCPSTLPPTLAYVPGDISTYWVRGTAKHRWRYQGDTSANQYGGAGAEGSYGLNQWIGGIDIDAIINQTYGWGGWLTEADKKYSFRNKMPGRANIPVFGDSKWIGAYPVESDFTSGSWNEYGIPEAGQGLNETDDGVNRYYVDRHNDAINMSFADAHVEKVKLEDCWRLKWNATLQMEKADVKF